MLYTNYTPTPTPKFDQDILGPTDQLIKDGSSQGLVYNFNIIDDEDEATLSKMGTVKAMEKYNNTLYPRVAPVFPGVTSIWMVKHYGTSEVHNGIPFTANTGTNALGTASSAGDGDGGATRYTQTGTAFGNRQWGYVHDPHQTAGWHVWIKIKIPTTGAQTSTLDRAFRFGLYSAFPTNFSTALTSNHAEIYYRESADETGWLLATADGTTRSTKAMGGPVVALGTLYIIELWSTGNTGAIFGRINGAAPVGKNSNIPTGEFSAGMLYAYQQEVDQGEAAVDIYAAGMMQM